MAKRDKSPRAERNEPDRKSARRSPAEHWKEEPDEHDYPAARDFLTLLLDEARAGRVVSALQQKTVSRRKAKDLLRAGRLPLLGPDDPEVVKDLNKVRHGGRLSPVLVVRGDLASDVAMTVADGYHRICASYHLDEDADIPCRIADLPPQSRSANGTRREGARRRAAPLASQQAGGGG